VARHVFRCQLRWSDMDAYGHVSNASYLLYLQEARVDMLYVHAPEQAVARLAQGIVVARHEIDYRAPLVFRPEPVRVETWVSQLGNSSVTIAYQIRDDDVVYADAATVLVPFDLAAGRPRRITPEERAVLETLTDAP
jgi:acyl-CoA thioester hydrolase